MLVSGAMMKLMIKEVAEAKGYRNAKDLADKLSMSYSIIYPMWKGEAKRIDLATLEKLCKALQVQPGMLIMFIDTDALGSDSSSQPVSETSNKARRTKSTRSESKTRARSAGATIG
jgi:DNA-binding Xre family transcriptional regulator